MTLVQENNQIIEAEIVTPPVTPGATAVLNLTGLINSHIHQIDSLKTKLGKLREMLDDIFRNDATYQTHDQAVREAAKIRNVTKKQILKLPQAADLQNQITSLRSQIKEHNEELSGYLQDYATNSGTTSFETDDGTVRQIVYVAKLVKIGT
jgi:chromosome segregation ATPase